MLGILLFLQLVVSPTMVLLQGFLRTRLGCEVLSDPTNIRVESFLACYIHINIPQLVRVIALAAFSFGQS